MVEMFNIIPPTRHVLQTRKIRQAKPRLVWDAHDAVPSRYSPELGQQQLGLVQVFENL